MIGVPAAIAPAAMPGSEAPSRMGTLQHQTRIRGLLLGAALVAPFLVGSRAGAQGAERAASADPPERYCFGFAFGAWSPPLDARRAGHTPLPPAAGVPATPEGRDWAASGMGASLVLFPAWWPAGVSVQFPRGAPMPGDTVRGQAHAFVADGRTEAPTAPVRAWVVPCARPLHPRRSRRGREAVLGRSFGAVMTSPVAGGRRHHGSAR